MMKKTEVEIANEVIAGKWGTGKGRETKLSKAGYDYNTIQAMVNEIIKTGKPILELEVDTNKCCGVVINIKV